jgi:type III restriction enzyme
MSERFFHDPILNSPYERPSRHWELDGEGIPSQKIVEYRRESRLITPIPKPRKRGGKGELAQQRVLELDAQGLSADDQQYEVSQQINAIRALVEEWRQAPENQVKMTRDWRTSV